MDGYSMPIADMLVDAADGHKVIRFMNNKFGKWLPNWEGPYRIIHCAPGNAYILKTLEGREDLIERSMESI